MASYTENLNLLKKDPTADASDTFNIRTMFNNNWDKLDANAAAVAAELAGKAGLYITALTGSVPQTWAELWAIGPGRYTWIQPAPLPWEPGDTPTGQTQVELAIHSKPDLQTALTAELRYTNGATTLCFYIGEQVSNATDGRWSGKIATATPPMEYETELMNGFTKQTGDDSSGVRYCKTQEGIVIGSVRVQTTSAITMAQFATMPSDCLPTRAIYTVCWRDWGSGNIAHMGIDPNGLMWLNTPSASGVFAGIFAYRANA